MNLTRAQLAAERAASLKRQAAKRPEIGPAPQAVPMHVSRGGRVRPIDVARKRIVECRCGREFVRTHGKQTLCLTCRAERSSGRKV